MHITMDPGHQRVTTSAAQNLTAHFPGDGRLDFLEDFPFEIPVTIVELIMAVIILLGNGLVIAAYISDRKLRTVTNFFLVNLVIADFIVGIALPISCSTYFIRVRSPAICILQFAVIAVPLGSSTLCLLLITVERYLSVVYPFHHQHIFTKARRYTLVFISWALAILIMGIVPFLIRKDEHPIIYKMDCDMMRVIPSQYWSYVVLPFAYILFGSVIIVYMKILRVARMQIKSIELLVLQVSVSDKKNMQNVRLARTGFILLGVFIMCWLPITIILTITVAGDFTDNQILTTARIAATVLAPASSFLNPIIYAARIRRFKIRMKKLLHMTISNSDKFDTYEIRQSFKVKRTAATSPIKKIVEPVPSTDSGVGGSHDCSLEDGYQDSSDIYDHSRNRALSRISESPESSSQLGSLPQLQMALEHKRADTRRISINDQTINLHADTNHDHIPTLDRKPRRTVQPPQFLDIPSITNESTYMANGSYTEERSSSTAIYENVPHPQMRVKPPGQTSNRDIKSARRNSTAAICDPIVIDCDNKSEYFRLVVRRTVRDCSDSDSEQDSKEPTTGFGTLSRYFKSNKQKVKAKPSDGSDGVKTEEEGQHNGTTIKTPDEPPKLFVTQSFTPNGSHSGTLERSPRIIRANHQRSSSALSNGSVELTLDNDDIQFQISNTNRGSKRMSKFMHLNQSSLQRKPKKAHKTAESEEEDMSADSSDEVSTPKGKAPPSNLVKDIWDGTIRRLKTGKSKLLRHDKVSSTHSVNQLERHLSHSLTDVTEPTMPIETVVHQRSRSALAENEVYMTTANITAPAHSSFQSTSVIMQGNSVRASMELQIDVNNLQTTYHTASPTGYSSPDSQSSVAISNVKQRFMASQHKRIRQYSWSHTVDEDTEQAELKNSIPKHSNNNYSLHSPSDNQLTQNGGHNLRPQQGKDHSPSVRAVHTRSVSNPYTSQEPEAHEEPLQKIRTGSISKYYKPSIQRVVTEAINDVILPVRLRLPGGLEQDLLLTKQDIYGNHHKPKRRHKSLDVTVKRKRSMSQPNLYAKHLAK